MEDRTRNILIGLVVLFGVLGAGTLFLPPLKQQGPGGPGAAERARARRLMEEGNFGEAESALQRLAQQHAGTPLAEQAQADRQYGIPYHQALRMAQGGQAAQAQEVLRRIAREGANTEWAARAQAELGRLGPPGATGPPPPAAAPEAARQARLAQANALLEGGQTEEARGIYQGLVNEGVEDQVAAAARLALATLQAAGQVVPGSPEVGRARVALHRARASLLAYRGANGRYPPSLQDRGLEQFGFSYQDLLSDVQRVESYRPEGGNRFEITAVARDARGTRVRATDQAVEDLP